jgi:hypothetical protein
MLIEQGFLCAYTMQRIQGVDDCHIEHIIPQSQPPQSHGRDLDYANMLACFPGTQLDPSKLPRHWNPRFPYGAIYKGNTEISENNFVSPLCANVEERFQFDQAGFVRSDTRDTAASISIRILNLNHGTLQELRRAAIDEYIFESPLSAADAEALAVSIALPDSVGMLPEFSVAVSQVCRWYAEIFHQTGEPQ